MTRREHGYLPLVNSFPTVKQKFTLAGGAIHDLDVNLSSVADTKAANRPTDGPEQSTRNVADL